MSQKNLNRGESYIGSPGWIKNKKATIILINEKENKCFQYALTVALNHEEVKKDLQRITKIKFSINKYNWKGRYWKKYKKNNIKIALNVLYAKKEKIYFAYVSKHNSKRGKQVTL